MYSGKLNLVLKTPIYKRPLYMYVNLDTENL